MGFGGTGSMSVVMKNNRNLLPKRDKFKRTLGGSISHKKTEYNLPKAKPHVLRQIREKIKHERQDRFKKRLLLFSMLIVSLIITIAYYL